MRPCPTANVLHFVFIVTKKPFGWHGYCEPMAYFSQYVLKTVDLLAVGHCRKVESSFGLLPQGWLTDSSSLAIYLWRYHLHNKQPPDIAQTQSADLKTDRSDRVILNRYPKSVIKPMALHKQESVVSPSSPGPNQGILLHVGALEHSGQTMMLLSQLCYGLGSQQALSFNITCSL